MARAIIAALLWLLAAGASADFGELKKKEEKYLQRVGRKFMNKKANEKGVIKFPSGLLIKIVRRYTGRLKEKRSPLLKDVVNVTYNGTLRDGKEFDSGTQTFMVGSVIPGWREALQLMCEGEKWQLFVPHELAYGSLGSEPRIPPYAPLVFDVEMHGITEGRGKSCEDARWEFEAKMAGWSIKYLVWWMSSTNAGQILGMLASVLLVILAVVMEYKYWCRRRARGRADGREEAAVTQGAEEPKKRREAKEPKKEGETPPAEGSKKDD